MWNDEKFALLPPFRPRELATYTDTTRDLGSSLYHWLLILSMHHPTESLTLSNSTLGKFP